MQSVSIFSWIAISARTSFVAVAVYAPTTANG